MPKKTIPLLERINQSEQKIKQLIEQRNKELLGIITRFKAISIDNDLLAGFILFAKNPENKDHPILKEFKTLITKNKTPSSTKK